MKNIYLVTLIVLFFYNQNSFSQQKIIENTIQLKLDEFISLPQFYNAGISCYIKDIESNEVIAKYNENLKLSPASLMKIVTTSTAMQKLGLNFRFKTKLYISGKIDSNGVLNGDIFVRGGGDPTLGSKYFNSKATQSFFLLKWVEEIKKLGIKKIKGRVISDASVFENIGAPSGWSWSDMGNYYGAFPSGLCIYDNILNVQFKTGKKHGDSTQIVCTYPYIQNLKIRNYVTSSRIKKDNSYGYSAPYSNDYFFTGTLPIGKDSFIVKGAIENPALLCALEFEKFLEMSGISIKNQSTTLRSLNVNPDSIYNQKNYTLVYTHYSASLLEILNQINRNSINLFAECVLKAIAIKNNYKSSTYIGVLETMKFLKDKIDVSGISMTDGSGLSRSNSISSKFLTDYLIYISNTKYSKYFESTLAVMGKSGTLSSLCRRQLASSRIKAKSGSMTGIKAYAGYAYTINRKKIAFSIIINNYNGKAYKLKKHFESFFNHLSSY